MKAERIAELFERLGRLSAAINQKAGTETSWTYTSPDGETQRYVVRGLKSHSEMQDSIFHLIVWIGSAKDYLKKWAKDNGKDPKTLDEEMRRTTIFLFAVNWLIL
jgi:hypothetical protein